MPQGVCEVTATRKQEQAARVDIETPDANPAHAVFRWQQRFGCGSATRIACRADHAFGFVQRDDADPRRFRRQTHRFAVERDPITC